MMIQEAEERATVRSQPSLLKSSSPVIKPQAAADVDDGPLYSGYALTPGIHCDTIQCDVM